MESNQMRMLYELVPGDTEVKLMWHLLPKDKEYTLPAHDDMVYVLFGKADLLSEVDDNKEEHHVDVLTMLVSPKGTKLKLKNIGKEPFRFFMIRVPSPS